MMSAPVPAPPAWPAAQAQTIIDHAVRYGVTAAVDTVNQIKDWLGHPERVAEVARQWSPVATETIIQSGKDLGETTSSLEPYWEGHSREAFFTFSASLKSTIDTYKFPFQQMAGALTESLNIIRDAYKAGTDLIFNIAIDILEAAKSVPDIVGGIFDITRGAVTRNPGKIAEGVRGLLGGAAVAVITLLQGFVARARDILKFYADSLTALTQTILRLESAESGLRVPDAAGEALNTPEWWRVHPAPRSNGVEFPPDPGPTEPPRGPGNNSTPPPAPGMPGQEGGSPAPDAGDPGSGSGGGGN